MSTRAPLAGTDIRKHKEGNVAPETALYRSLVRLFLPVHFRERHGEELVWVFSELLREARARSGLRGRATIWLRETPSLLQLTWRVRRRGYRPGLEDAVERDQSLRR